MLKTVSIRAMGGFLLSATLAALTGCAGDPAAELRGEGPPPNVLLLAIDTLRGDHLGCYGAENVSTPNIDALAADGVLFSRCYATAPWTLPSFASIYTGLRPWRHGAVGGPHLALADSLTTLAERFAAAGYATSAAITINYVSAECGMDQGFGRFVDLSRSGSADQGLRVTNAGVKNIAAAAAGPFLQLLHWFDVHAPYTPPPPFDRMYYQGDEKAPGDPITDMLMSDRNRAANRDGGMYDWLEGVTDIEFPSRQYEAGVTCVDSHVGRILDTLREEGAYDRTLIVLFADHGEHLGEHDIWFTHSLPYVEALRVPLIVKLPLGREAGRVVEEPVSTLDILPTLIDAAGLDEADDIDGRSLASLLLGKAGRGVSLTLSEQGGLDDVWSKSLVEWPWQLVLLHDADGERLELYDLGADPAAENDLAAAEPVTVDRLRAKLGEYVDESSPVVVGGGGKAVELDEDSRRRLRSLGY